MEFENNRFSVEPQQNLEETDRLLKEFGPAWKRLIQHFSQNSPVPLHDTSINPTQGQGWGCIGLQEHYERSSNPKARILDCFYDIKDNVLIDIDPKEYQITLSFSFKQYGSSYKIFKDLCWYSSGWLLRQKNPTEFTFGFARICDLKAIAWAIAMEYREIGYRSRIRCGDEIVEVESFLAVGKKSPEWAQSQEVATCA